MHSSREGRLCLAMAQTHSREGSQLEVRTRVGEDALSGALSVGPGAQSLGLRLKVSLLGPAAWKYDDRCHPVSQSAQGDVTKSATNWVV